MKQYRFAEMQQSAIAVINFVASLQREEFQQFWLPCKLLAAYRTIPFT